MFGAIAGDIIGSKYEKSGTKSKEIPIFEDLFDESTFTDDTILTIATADGLLNDNKDYRQLYSSYCINYPNRGWGSRFYHWAKIQKGGEPYESWGNGSAMRVSPVGWRYDNIKEIEEEAEKTASVSHNHPEGIKGAKAVAIAVWMSRTGKSKIEIKDFIQGRYGYDLDRNLDDIRPEYEFDVSCQGSVPEAIICFLEADSFEDAILNAISLGGDADTQASIAGAIAEGHFGVPEYIKNNVLERLDENLVGIFCDFMEKYSNIK